MKYRCRDESRPDAVRLHATLNGIEYLEVLDQDAPSGLLRQQTLLVRCFKPIPALTKDNVRIDGGERIQPVRALWAFPPAAIPDAFVTSEEKALFSSLPEAQRTLVVRTDKAGDFSNYTFTLTRSTTDSSPPDDFDPILSAVDFSFKVECPSDFDCKTEWVFSQERPSEPEIDYLAKDYASFRRLMLDRMSALIPDWQENSPADLGIALVELLAYVGDHLSYQQDAVATEACWSTARRRVSIRRHARLVDYVMHDGCNARAWVQIQVDQDDISILRSTPILTHLAAQKTQLEPDSPAYRRALDAHPVVFETMHEATLYSTHNEMFFYTWGNTECSLPSGATRATLIDNQPNLKQGDVLVFEELLDPRTGQPEDADLAHRHAVRLTSVTSTDNGGTLHDPLNGQPITEIEWAVEDALPFSLCISAVTDEEHGRQYKDGISVALGNMVLVDHGLWTKGEPLGVVPRPMFFRTPTSSHFPCGGTERTAVHPRFRPALRNRPLTQVAPYDPAASATAAMHWSMRDALPAIYLESTLDLKTRDWTPKRDLLSSGPASPEFVVESESDGTSFVRFGDDVLGLRPGSGTSFTASYRTGNGAAGNVGAEAFGHVVTFETHVVKVRNPMPARGGIEPESHEKARQQAPHAFRTQERAVTEEDYSRLAQRHSQVQRAEGTFRWTGSWHTAFVTVDRLEGRPTDQAFELEMREFLERYRMAGYDLEIDGPRYVSLELDMSVCLKPDYFRSDVKKALLEVFSNRIMPDGRRGVFHPDNFSFGQPVFLSRLYAAAQGIPGVESANITTFQRLGTDDPQPLDDGKLRVGRLEIARLDNDPNFPERGVFRLDLAGGK